MIDHSPGFNWDDELRKGAFGTGPAHQGGQDAEHPAAPLVPPTAQEHPVAPPRAVMEPAAVESRRSGRQVTRGPGTPGDGWFVYRDALRIIQPATDHQVSAYVRTMLGLDGRDHIAWGLSSINGRRNDWCDFDPGCIQAAGKVRPPGGRASRTLWQIRPGSKADTLPSPSKGGAR